MSDFETALAISPKDSIAYLGRAKILQTRGRLEDALTDYNTVARLSPRNHSAFYARASCHMEKRAWGAAINDLTHAISLCPGAASYWYLRGYVHFRAGCYSRALGDYNKAIALLPGASLPRFMRAYLRLGIPSYWTQAIEDCDSGLAKDPESSSEHMIPGIVRLCRGEFPTAARDFAVALRTSEPKDDYLALWLFLARIGCGEFDGAAIDLQSHFASRDVDDCSSWPEPVARLFWQDASLSKGSGAFCVELNQLIQALNEPNDTWEAMALSGIYLKIMNKDLEALSCLRQLPALDERNWELSAVVSYLLHELARQ